MTDITTVNTLVEVYADDTKAMEFGPLAFITGIAIVTIGVTLYPFRKVVS